MSGASYTGSMLPDVEVRARDGARLPTDVHLPERSLRSWPTVFHRTPYGRRKPYLLKLARRWNRAGLAVVLQDYRPGAGGDPATELARATDDGFDTLAWLPTRDWFDGRVGLFGISASGYPMYRLAAQAPPDGVEVAALVSLMGTVDHHSLFYRNGAVVHHWALPWSVMMAPDRRGELDWQHLPWTELFAHLPLESVGERTHVELDDWRRMVAHPERGPGWEELDARPAVARLSIPTLHLSGWYDFMLGQSLSAYRAMRSCPEQRLVLGPWDHQTIFFSLLAPGRSVTPLGGEAPLDLSALVCDWLRRWLTDAPTPLLDRLAPVTLFAMGGGGWLRSELFPPRATSERWYLDSSGEDGRLVPEVPAASRRSYRYDPADPVPTCGGAIWPFQPRGLQPGPEDQRAVERRDDVLVYTGPALRRERWVVGPVGVELWAESSAVDTDFTAKLVDVAPDGLARIVTDGIVRARFRDGTARERPLTAGVHRFSIELQATAHRFAAGHRIRVEIASSNFPKFSRNLNTGGPLHAESTPTVAVQTVHHGDRRASLLRLPCVSPDGAAVRSCHLPEPWRAVR